jgi:small-conductance mechanosensitive channel
MFYSILVGLGLTACTVAVHALGATSWIQWQIGRNGRGLQRPSWWLKLRALSATVIVLLLLHILEVGIWAAAYLALPQITEIQSFEEAAYFSIVTFTTLGYGDITLHDHWRLLSGIEAMNGILLFGWSTVAGLILLFERPIRVGDIVTIDDTTGVVSRIRIRTTTITNWDRKEFIVPNKEFITGKLLNWTLSDHVNRIVIEVGVAYGSNDSFATLSGTKAQDGRRLVPNSVCFVFAQ